MFDLEQLIDFDKHLLLMMNGSDSLFFDGVMHVYTTTVVWIPFALALVYLLIKNNSLMNLQTSVCAFPTDARPRYYVYGRCCEWLPCLQVWLYVESCGKFLWIGNVCNAACEEQVA